MDITDSNWCITNANDILCQVDNIGSWTENAALKIFDVLSISLYFSFHLVAQIRLEEDTRWFTRHSLSDTNYLTQEVGLFTGNVSPNNFSSDLIFVDDNSILCYSLC